MTKIYMSRLSGKFCMGGLSKYDIYVYIYTKLYTIDVIIGTYCIREELPLLHDDRDFDPMVSHLALKFFSPA